MGGILLGRGRTIFFFFFGFSSAIMGVAETLCLSESRRRASLLSLMEANPSARHPCHWGGREKNSDEAVRKGEIGGEGSGEGKTTWAAVACSGGRRKAGAGGPSSAPSLGQ